MRLKIGDHEVEGTVEEVAKLLSLISSPVEATPPLPSPRAQVRSDGPTPFISESRAYDVLTRRTLGETHANLLQVLYQAGDGWTAAPQLQSALGLSTRAFAGLLGAFGKRVSNTEGDGPQTFFDQYWNHDVGYNLYRLPPSVRAALERAQVVP
ncbi:MAG: hypothetical protein ABIW83_08670 [Allosphingosinicella sp.]